MNTRAAILGSLVLLSAAAAYASAGELPETRRTDAATALTTSPTASPTSAPTSSPSSAPTSVPVRGRPRSRPALAAPEQAPTAPPVVEAKDCEGGRGHYAEESMLGNWTLRGCKTELGAWHGNVDLFHGPVRRRVELHDDGALRQIMVLDEASRVVTIRVFDPEENVVDTKFYKADRSRDPSGVWGP